MASHAAPMAAIDSPLSLRYIPFHFTNEDADQSALKLVEALDSEWTNTEGPVVFVRFTEGITNTLTKATKKKPGRRDSQIEKEAVLIRAYGRGTDLLIDRERELRAHNLLASRGLAPPLLARFGNGLLYRFIPGEVCTPEDLRRPEVYRAVAKRLGQWHGSLPISAITATPDLGVEPTSQHCAAQNGKNTRPYPNVWTVMQQWIEALPSKSEEERSRNAVLHEELAWLSSTLGDTPGIDGRDYVFCHCDLLSGNVIIQHPEKEISTNDEDTNGSSSEAERPVSFIDYEYTTAGPSAFDIANHFAEWAGFDCDYAGIPTRSRRLDFLKHYVGSYRYHSISDSDNLSMEVDFYNDVVQLNKQVDMFRGIPGFYWGIWALIQATISQIDFDYASYAELRLAEYWQWKAELDGSRAREGKELSLRERRWAET